jgi:DNA topoisomerase VI subunit B
MSHPYSPLPATNQRLIAVTLIALDFFTAQSLSRQIGFRPRDWVYAILKEVIDNSLDACEGVGITPEITVIVTNDHVVRDNGPGLPLATIDAACDYSVRVSDKAPFASPSRGQSGNALKTLFAATFVGSGNTSDATVIETGGHRHVVTISLDRIAAQPHITRESSVLM